MEEGLQYENFSIESTSDSTQNGRFEKDSLMGTISRVFEPKMTTISEDDMDHKQKVEQTMELFKSQTEILATQLEEKEKHLNEQKRTNNSTKSKYNERLIQEKDRHCVEVLAQKESNQTKIEEKLKEISDKVEKMKLKFEQKKNEIMQKNNVENDKNEEKIQNIRNKHDEERAEIDKKKTRLTEKKMKDLEEFGTREMNQLREHDEKCKELDNKRRELEMKKFEELSEMRKKEKDLRQQGIQQIEKAALAEIENRSNRKLADCFLDVWRMVKEANECLVEGTPFVKCLDNEEKEETAKQHLNDWAKLRHTINDKVFELQRMITHEDRAQKSLCENISNAITKVDEEYKTVSTIPYSFEGALEKRDEQKIEDIANKLSEHSEKINQWVKNSNSVSQYAIQNHSQQNAIENQPQQ